MASTPQDQIVQLNIAVETQTVPQAGFGIPLILGSSNRFTGGDIVRAYSSIAAVATDFHLTDPEYIHAEECFEQELSPTEILIGSRSGLVAQVDHISVTGAVDNTLYEASLNGVNASYTSGTGSTVASILTGLAAALTALAGGVSFSAGSTYITATASVPGTGFSVTPVTGNVVDTSITQNYNVVNDIMAIIAVNNTWYGLDLCSESDADILAAAAYIETVLKIFIAVSSDAAIATTVTTDILSTLKSKAYTRTALIYSPQVAQGHAAAWLGGQLPNVPGANTWKFKDLIGITADSLTDTAKAAILGVPISQVPGKNGNIYDNIGGVNMMREGWMVGGQFIDITVGVDWLKTQLQGAIVGALKNANKVPFTNKGIDIISQAMKSVFDQAVVNGLVADDTPVVISFPLSSQVPTSFRANRILPNGAFTCRLAGALHGVIINGTVTV
jgi:hypothetical protein